MLQRRPSSRKSLFLCIFRSHPTTRAPPPRALVDDLQTAVAAAGPPPEAAAPPHNNGAAGVTLERQFTVPAPIYLCSAAANLGSSMRNAGGARVPSWMARLLCTKQLCSPSASATSQSRGEELPATSLSSAGKPAGRPAPYSAKLHHRWDAPSSPSPLGSGRRRGGGVVPVMSRKHETFFQSAT
ncbi:hypothetical protein VPH35_081994 [Triticum aestivum]|uniref:uncharacterized protein n=1 Tax=Triticum aestivum TaxID=4565 RepID=UPI001D0282B0|nr:uncharacterized protein LOC123102657 [Triticum aestivum]